MSEDTRLDDLVQTRGKDEGITLGRSLGSSAASLRFAPTLVFLQWNNTSDFLGLSTGSNASTLGGC